MKKVFFVILLLIFIGLLYFFLVPANKNITQNSSTLQHPSATLKPVKSNGMKISSTAFANNTTIPTKYTCDGASINPPLTFENIPQNAKSVVMLMDDHDVPKSLKPDGVFDHWVLYNIPQETHEIAENSVPHGVSQGLNGSGQEKYTGPCPPDRQHRYFFTLYALDTTLLFKDPAKVTKQMVIDNMKGHIIDQAELVGVYNRPQNQK